MRSHAPQRTIAVWRSVFVLLSTVLAITLRSSAAHATFTGSNGRIAYTNGVDPTHSSPTAIFVTGSGQLTFPDSGAGISDTEPAWSPAGDQVAFLRGPSGSRGDRIEVVDRSGTGLRTLISYSDLDPNGFRLTNGDALHAPAWTSDGRRISFVFRDGALPFLDGIWTIPADGSGVPVQTIQNHAANSPNWSGNKMVYTCTGGETGTGDLCVYDATTGSIRDLGITAFGGSGAARPKWSPDGRKITFVRYYTDPTTGITSHEIVAINGDGSGLTRLTSTSAGSCTGGGGDVVSFPTMERFDPTYSPDGEYILFYGYKDVAGGGGPNYPSCDGPEEAGLWVVPADGGVSSLLLQDSNGAIQYDWQPITADLTVKVLDGELSAADAGPHSLKGLKVELCNQDGCGENGSGVIDDKPLNMVGGSYAFEHVPSGDYRIRATLIDDDLGTAGGPSFEIRHTETATEAVWIEETHHQDTAGSPHFELVEFTETDFIVDSNVPAVSRDRLGAMANMYFRMRQYVDWVKLHLRPDTGDTVEIYTYATADPWGGAADPTKLGAYYDPPHTAIVLSPLSSDYENRDGVTGEDRTYEAGVLVAGHDDDGPENVEWHEFTHHLYHQFVNNRNSDPTSTCNINYVPHAGYNNPDTCDSMDEGFAIFLPTLAAQDIEGVADAQYDDFGFDFDDVKYNAWGYRQDVEGSSTFDIVLTQEDAAVAGLFWDLVDSNVSNPDCEVAQVIGQDGNLHSVTYCDRVTVPLGQLWSQMTSFHVATVANLLSSFGTTSLTVDLDGDGVMDVSSIDVTFLMHGFFPIDTDQTIHGLPTTPPTYHYDVNYAQSHDPSLRRDAAVGLSSHYVYDETLGIVTGTLIPRNRLPAESHANFAVDVLDDAGNPVSGAVYALTLDSTGTGSGTTLGGGRYGGLKLNMDIQSPGGREQVASRWLTSGDGAVVHLELPPYFDYLLPTGASLPDCDPANDAVVQVTLSAETNGNVSSENPSFDNCTYQHMMAAATGSVALSYVLTIPGSTIPTATVSAIPDAESGFTGWTGPDAAECATGSVLMNGNKSCTATFTLNTHTLTLSTTGTGSGTVSGGGTYTSGQTATVSATPNPGSSFAGWSGPDANECGTGSVVMNADKSCVATFTLNRYTLTIASAGTGSGTTTGSGTYDYGQTATVTATANSGSDFTGWSGPNGTECATGSVLMNDNKSCVANFGPDTTPPSGTISINNGAAATNTKSVTLNLSCTDNSGCIQMQFSNEATRGWSKFQPFAATATWTLSSGDGTKAVYVRFQDGVGNTSTPFSHQILLDTAAPSGTIAIDGGASFTNTVSASLTLTCTDSGAGCSRMQFSNDGTTYTPLEPCGTTKGWILPAGNGTKTVYVRYQDGAGNLSTAKSAQITLDTTIPTGSIVINGAATYANKIAVTLSLTCSAPRGSSGCSQMQFSNDGSTWSALQSYATTAAWTLTTGDGTKSVSARFVNGAGTVSAVYTAQITLDATLPTGTILINNDAATTITRSVTLTLSCSDPGSGCSQMQFSDTGTSGWSKLQAYSTSASYTLSNGSGTKTVYARFVDAAGNVSVNASDSIVLQ